jgi:hypothetical protein
VGLWDKYYCLTVQTPRDTCQRTHLPILISRVGRLYDGCINLYEFVYKCVDPNNMMPVGAANERTVGTLKEPYLPTAVNATHKDWRETTGAQFSSFPQLLL